MRIELILSENKTPIPFNYNHKLISSLHRIIGIPNRWHDMPYSPYSISSIIDTKAKNGFIYTLNGISKIIITSHVEEFIYDLIEGLKSDNELFFGVRVLRVVETEVKLNRDKFLVASPIFLRNTLEDGKVDFLTYDNPLSSKHLLESCLRKMDVYQVEGKLESICFDLTYKNAKTRLIQANQNSKIKKTVRANICPIIIKADQNVKKFLCDVGIGALTGSGYGCII